MRVRVREREVRSRASRTARAASGSCCAPSAACRLSPCSGSGSRPASFARTSSQCAGMITKRTLRDHDRPEHRADLDRYAARGAKSCADAVRGRRDERERARRRAASSRLPSSAAERVVDEPRRRRAARCSSAIAAPVSRSRDRRVDRGSCARRGSRGRRSSAKPLSHVVYASHLYQCSGSGIDSRRDAELLDAVEAAAVDLPRLAGDALVASRRPARRAQVVVERDEVEGRADPDDRRDRRAASGTAGRASRRDTRRRRSRMLPAVAARSRRARASAVSSSSSRVRSSRVAQHADELALRPPVDEDDEAEAELLLVDLVQVRELGEHLGVAVGALLAAERSERFFAPIRGCASSASTSFVLAAARRRRRRARRAGRRSSREPLDEARAALEELGELVDAQLPR